MVLVVKIPMLVSSVMAVMKKAILMTTSTMIVVNSMTTMVMMKIWMAEAGKMAQLQGI